jgi:predicted DNA-binding transcriptional regulator YafY
MSLLAGIRRLLGGYAASHAIVAERIPEAPEKPKFGQYEPDEEVASNLADPQRSSALVFIRYTDAQGARSQRRITMKRLFPRGDDIYIEAYCHERLAARHFYASRIREIVDMETGETSSDAVRFLRDHVLYDPIGGERADNVQRLFSDYYDEIQILVYLGRCDGRFAHPEKAAIVEHIVACGDGIEIDESKMLARLGRTRPDGDDLLDSIESLADDDDRLVELVKGVASVITADGRVADEEVEFLAELQSTLADAGISLQIELQQN